MTPTSPAKAANPLRESKAPERQLSGALMAGAFALMCVALASIPPAFPSLTPLGRGLAGGLSLLAVIAYLVSVGFGGRGWVGTAQAGSGNPFNLQALAGLAGFLLHAAALAALGMNGAEDTTRLRVAELERRLTQVTSDLRLAREALADVRPQTAEVRVTCSPAAPPQPCVVK
jgi:hypothetical protein